MKKTPRLMAVLGAGGLVAGSLLTASSASAGQRGADGKSVMAQPHLTTAQDIVRQTSSAVTLSTSGGVATTLASVTVDAGSYVLAGNATLVYWGSSDYSRCTLYAGETALGGAATVVGNPAGAGSAGTGVYAATVAVHGAVSATSPTTVSLRCQHDSNRDSAPYVDPTATLWVHNTGSFGLAKR
ncbi:hypothetical protein ACH427_27935 [Streptomyces sp. NPDC020379]|uniref:hypothetical protein n=1 Tax=Streptomyces sp. NPDC020379 TaxID=3365071 RepID=UPI0037AA25D4